MPSRLTGPPVAVVQYCLIASRRFGNMDGEEFLNFFHNSTLSRDGIKYAPRVKVAGVIL
jgi:hypothetical protein